mmetsp:Transcript_11371/g.37986  ORF Transcript_11371/g.37986 Transcript_11371/m.37986 type:complete len:277 (+) Transcript_11371:189-1019(+)
MYAASRGAAALRSAARRLPCHSHGLLRGAVQQRSLFSRPSAFPRGVLPRSSLRAPLKPALKRGFLSMPDGDALPVLGGIIGLNVGVWVLWQVPSVVPQHEMVRHFTLSFDKVLERPHTLLTHFFSHKDGWHLIGNMMTVFFFGPEVIAYVGAKTFLSLYLGSGLLAGLCQLLDLMRKNAYSRRGKCLGASGAVNAIVAWSCLASPWRLIVIFAEFIPVPLPAIAYGGLFLSKDVAALLDVHIPYVSDRMTAHGAHVAGALCGAAHFALFRRGGRRF